MKKLSQKKKKILIIKFGGLGDFVLSLKAMNYIKNFHDNDKLVLLTEKAYYEIAKKSGWFDEIVIIKRTFMYFFDKVQIQKKINVQNYKVVYDLQTSKRSSSYYQIFKNSEIKWSGIVKDNIFFHSNPSRDSMHTLDRQKDQLLKANIRIFNKPNFDWLYGKNEKNFMKKPYALIIPGGSVKRKYKRIPVDYFIKICAKLIENNIIPVLIGSADEKSLCEKINYKCKKVVNLCEKFSIIDLALISKKSKVAIGNDTGLMHLFGMSGVPTIVLFTKHSNPNLCAPIGEKVKILEYKINIKELVKDSLEIFDFFK